MYNYAQHVPDECEFVGIGSLSDIPVGGRVFFEIDGLPIVVFNIAGRVFAIADICSHDDGPLGDGELEGYEISCPRHGARFNVQSGKALALPAVVDIPAYPVQINDGQISIGIPINK